jgi:hypothetical protein
MTGDGIEGGAGESSAFCLKTRALGFAGRSAAKPKPPSSHLFSCWTISSSRLPPGGHFFCGAGSDFGRQMERPTRHHELAFPLMVYRARLFPRGVNPRLDDLQNEEVVFGGKP